MTPRRRSARSSAGFSLIEVMIAVGILGMLSTVAIPNFERLRIRSRSAERASVMVGISRAVTDIVQNQQRVPADGEWNPATPPDSSRHPMSWTMDGWKELPILVEGDTYYSYKFVITDGSALDPPARYKMLVFGTGDLDADGVTSTRMMTFSSDGEGFRLIDDVVDDAAAN
jgi:prepilin-type N-terminal cleavage/methylation domain-containing protein